MFVFDVCNFIKQIPWIGHYIPAVPVLSSKPGFIMNQSVPPVTIIENDGKVDTELGMVAFGEMPLFCC